MREYRGSAWSMWDEFAKEGISLPFFLMRGKNFLYHILGDVPPDKEGEEGSFKQTINKMSDYEEFSKEKKEFERLEKYWKDGATILPDIRGKYKGNKWIRALVWMMRYQGGGYWTIDGSEPVKEKGGDGMKPFVHLLEKLYELNYVHKITMYNIGSKKGYSIDSFTKYRECLNKEYKTDELTPRKSFQMDELCADELFFYLDFMRFMGFVEEGGNWGTRYYTWEYKITPLGVRIYEVLKDEPEYMKRSISRDSRECAQNKIREYFTGNLVRAEKKIINAYVVFLERNLILAIRKQKYKTNLKEKIRKWRKMEENAWERKIEKNFIKYERIKLVSGKRNEIRHIFHIMQLEVEKSEAYKKHLNLENLEQIDFISEYSKYISYSPDTFQELESILMGKLRLYELRLYELRIYELIYINIYREAGK